MGNKEQNVKVKICGITSFEDALHATQCGADALGFVFYEKSPRYIVPTHAKEIITKLPPFVEKVGLFVHVSAKDVNQICRDVGITLAQIHFDADDSFFEALEVPFLRVVRAKTKEDVTKYDSTYRLVDAYVESYGGEGKRLDLALFEGVDCSKIILAGGLTAQNVAEVKKFGFYGVDVSSGVESDKGKKDLVKVKTFIANAKSL